jgi:3-oxoacyl-(acyl-carrier-protein) synthase
MVLLEEYHHARARGARIYGEILSYATAGVPVECLAEGVEQTVSLALSRAGKTGADVESICCASVFAEPFWEAERAGLERTFAHGRSPRLLEFKSRMGHTLAASGPIELGLAVQDFDDLSPGSVVLFNSVGYMGQTAALVAGREEAA